jgi:hypothetical protein
VPEFLPPLTEAGRHFGEAFCGPGNEQCIAQVGRAWEQRVEQSFGATVIAPGPGGDPLADVWPLTDRAGARVGSIVSVEGRVFWCLRSERYGTRCREVGQGAGAAAAAREVIGLLGFSVGPPVQEHVPG